MADVILVVLSTPERTSSLLDAAASLARLLGPANITALAIDAPLDFRPLSMEPLFPEAVHGLAASGHDPDRIPSLKAAFDHWTTTTQAAGVACRWHEAVGDEALIVEEKGRRADFIVTARPDPRDDRGARQAFHAALLATERPVLVVPPVPAAPIGRRIAIAWRDDRRAVKALVPSLRFLAQAEAVLVLAGVRAGKPRPDLPTALVEHGINPSLQVLPIGDGPFGQVLLNAAHDFDADLLIMGAYAHSPLREMILGGVTRYMLKHADLPVLMRH
jgi:nucleotide-binding universal stress UspA family protein